MSSTKAIITRRKESRNLARSNEKMLAHSSELMSEQTVADVINNDPNINLTVEQHITNGVIVSVNEGDSEGENSSLNQMEAQGCRVKIMPETNIIQVGAFRVDTESSSESAEIPPELSVPIDLIETWTHYLVQLVAPPTSEWIARIEEQGVDVAEPISRYALFVNAPPERIAALSNLKMPGESPESTGFIAWTGQFQPAYRIAPEILNMQGTIRYVNIGVYPETETLNVANAIVATGGQVVDRWEREGSYRDKFGFLIAEIESAQIAKIARLPHVRSIEYQSPTFSAEDERSAQIVAARLDDAPPPNTAPLVGYKNTLTNFAVDGEGVVIGICDSGVDTNDDLTMHDDLKGRLAFFIDLTNGVTPTDVKGHGTHVAGIALGNGDSAAADDANWSLGQGIAPRARFGSINQVDTRNGPGTKNAGLFTKLMVENGAHVMNNSWKQSETNRYTANSALIDRLVRDPSGDASDINSAGYLVLVFSAGNKGPWAGTITEPKAAKNPIIVGNSLNRRANLDIRGVWTESSRGPTADGRLSPTIMAPGTAIVSARPTNSTVNSPPMNPFRDDGNTTHSKHASMTGTSMAAPHVSGLCALLIQWWRTRHGGQNPSPALLKALLVNGAEDLAGGPDGNNGTLRHIPNNDQGWGRVSLSNIVNREPKLIYDQLFTFSAAGEENLFVVKSFDSTRPLRITLVWTDPPGAANAATALMNDLDLEVTEVETGQIFKGDVYANGFSQTGGNFDDLNNVECVYIKQPIENGIYEIRVIAQTLTGNALPPFSGAAFQDYALVIDNAEAV